MILSSIRSQFYFIDNKVLKGVNIRYIFCRFFLKQADDVFSKPHTETVDVISLFLSEHYIVVKI